MGAVSVSRTYDPRNLLLTNTRSNGVKGSYSFDPVGRLLNMSEQAGSSVIFSRAFTYDAAGQLVGNSVNSGFALATQAAIGTFDAANEVATFAATTYTSDADGNRLSEVSPAGTTSYTWDSRGRLQAVSAPGGVISAFAYDYAGNMIQERVTSTGQNNVQQFVLDDVSNIASVQQGQSPASSILDGRGPDDIIAFTQGGAPVFPLLDQISSDAALTDGSGNVLGREFYEPFGAPTTNGTVSLLQFTGRPLINTGLYYDRARYYDSATGRFLSEDPAGLGSGDANLYRYVSNSPLAFTDPTGLLNWKKIIPDSVIGGGAASLACFVPEIGWIACALAIGGGALGGAGAEAWNEHVDDQSNGGNNGSGGNGGACNTCPCSAPGGNGGNSGSGNGNTGNGNGTSGNGNGNSGNGNGNSGNGNGGTIIINGNGNTVIIINR